MKRSSPAQVMTAAPAGRFQRSQTGVTFSLARAADLLWSALREIFDESAYTRFLNRSQTPPSREAYAAFCSECEAARARRPRCC
jgi:hypothetical protein